MSYRSSTTIIVSVDLTLSKSSNAPSDDFLELIHRVCFDSCDDVVDAVDSEGFIHSLDFLEFFQDV